MSAKPEKKAAAAPKPKAEKSKSPVSAPASAPAAAAAAAAPAKSPVVAAAAAPAAKPTTAAAAKPAAAVAAPAAKPAAAPAAKAAAPKAAAPAAAAPAPAAAKPKPAKKEAAAPFVYDEPFAGEPAAPERKSKAAVAAEKKEEKKEERKEEAVDVKAVFSFTLPGSLVKEQNAKQLKAKLRPELAGFGVVDEIRVTAVDESTDKEILVFFVRLLIKGSDLKNKIDASEPAKITILGEELDLTLSDASPSGGGKSTGTDKKPSTKKPDSGRGGRGGRGGSDRGDRGGRGRGRGGRGGHDDE